MMTTEQSIIDCTGDLQVTSRIVICKGVQFSNKKTSNSTEQLTEFEEFNRRASSFKTKLTSFQDLNGSWKAIRVWYDFSSSSIFVLCNDEGKQKIVREHVNKLLAQGWGEWLRGRSGWEWGPKLQRSRKNLENAFDKLQDVYSTVVARIKDEEVRGRLLYVQSQAKCKKPLIWKKQTSLKGHVLSLRSLFEIILHYIREKRTKDISSKRYVAVNKNSERRWGRIQRNISSLLRGSKFSGPDCPVQWAAHANRNPYTYTLVTEESQQELLYRTVYIIKDLLYGFEEDQNGRFLSVGTVWYTFSETKWKEQSKSMRGFETKKSLRHLFNQPPHSPFKGRRN
mmetsp:Transcript_16243/g.19722  ORF Transcript_16243/g.19722 Transcript_16243/m.19722 type:complete len:339 (+) Transcript_16243:274-1290(+)